MRPNLQAPTPRRPAPPPESPPEIKPGLRACDPFLLRRRSRNLPTLGIPIDYERSMYRLHVFTTT
eukprot:89484-Prorocentrum_minimum.AAC.1